MTTDTTTTPPAKTRAFLTIAEAAAELGCTRRFLEMRIEDGELAVFRPSTRLVRIRRAELDRWVQAYTTGGVE
jgi:excisionase family DNA binding protein